jgi:ATP-binding cassette subfamily A (ABC1) protein 1
LFQSLLSNVAFGFGCAYLAHYEESGEGANWSNIWTSPIIGTGDKYSLAGAIGMLLVDSVLYGLLTWYIEAVWPGEFGVPKPWYFFVTRSYWFGSKTDGSESNVSEESDMELGGVGDSLSKNMEKEPQNLPLGVSVQHLHKVYPNGKVAIEDLNLNFYEGQITSFLGHNGAGKTTTM